jgi:hypothetical protein
VLISGDGLAGSVDAGGHIAYAWEMAVTQALIEELMGLDDRERVELAQLLLSTVEDEDDLDEHETSRLHAALERSLDDMKAGRVHDAHAVLDELRARHQP